MGSAVSGRAIEVAGGVEGQAASGNGSIRVVGKGVENGFLPTAARVGRELEYHAATRSVLSDAAVEIAAGEGVEDSFLPAATRFRRKLKDHAAAVQSATVVAAVEVATGPRRAVEISSGVGDQAGNRSCAIGSVKRVEHFFVPTARSRRKLKHNAAAALIFLDAGVGVAAVGRVVR